MTEIWSWAAAIGIVVFAAGVALGFNWGRNKTDHELDMAYAEIDKMNAVEDNRRMALRTPQPHRIRTADQDPNRVSHVREARVIARRTITPEPRRGQKNPGPIQGRIGLTQTDQGE